MLTSTTAQHHTTFVAPSTLPLPRVVLLADLQEQQSLQELGLDAGTTTTKEPGYAYAQLWFLSLLAVCLQEQQFLLELGLVADKRQHTPKPIYQYSCVCFGCSLPHNLRRVACCVLAGAAELAGAGP
jgi:hypothetical protein